MDKPSYFYGERGVFKLANPRNRRDVVIVEVQRGSVRLLKSPSNLWSLRSRLVAGATVLGSLIAYVTVGAFESTGASFAPSVLASFLILLVVVFVVVAVEERLFWPYVARLTQVSGLPVRIERVEYRHFYHAVTAWAEGRPLQFTVGGLRGRVRRAVALAGCEAA